MVDFSLTLNNFIHDFFSAMWVASVLIIYWLYKRAMVKQKEVSQEMLELARLFRRVLVASIVMIFFTGVFRTIAYNYFTKQTAVHTSAVIGKHIILILLAIFSLFYVWTVIRNWRQKIIDRT